MERSGSPPGGATPQETSMSNRSREVEYQDKPSKPGSKLRRDGDATPVMKGKPQQPAQSEKGDARRSDPRVNKGSQAQRNDDRDGMVQQGKNRQQAPEDSDRRTRDAEGQEALRHQQPAGRRDVH
jgi:hypothetical protein